MKPTRRRFLHLAGAAFALPGTPFNARAQTYPTRPVRIVVSGPPGGATDILARLLGPWLSERLGQPFVVENRPGAGSIVGTEVVVRSAADGHTLLMVAPTAATNATLSDKLSYNFIRDMAPVAGIIRVPLIVQVTPSIPIKTIPDLIAYAKSNPGRINMASAGNGTTPHVAGELFKMMADVNMVHVAYRGEAPALTDLMGGQVQVMFGTTTVSIEHVKAGKLRALAVTTAARSGVLPDLPTVGNFLPGYEASAWYGVAVPKDTPMDIIERLNAGINAGLADSKIKAGLAQMGGTALAGTPADFGNLIGSETEKWSKVIKFAGIRPE
jgi:tripartite-type tricarboxylate transporter receptor subunit TctC